jgi:hypothetical protein
MEEIFGLTKLEAQVNPVKVTFIAKEPGIYKLVWSNEHSWFKGKALKYRIAVLKPISAEDLRASPNREWDQSQSTPNALNISSKLTTSKRKAI